MLLQYINFYFLTISHKKSFKATILFSIKLLTVIIYYSEACNEIVCKSFGLAKKFHLLSIIFHLLCEDQTLVQLVVIHLICPPISNILHCCKIFTFHCLSYDHNMNNRDNFLTSCLCSPLPLQTYVEYACQFN